MELESKIREAYKYYKGLYGDVVIMFRVEDDYMVYFSDALWAAQVLGATISEQKGASGKIPTVSFSANDKLDVMAKLSEAGRSVRSVDHRDDNGVFVLPDVEILRQEREADY